MEAGSAGFDGKLDVEGDGDVKDGSQGFCLMAGGPAKLGGGEHRPCGARGSWQVAHGRGTWGSERGWKLSHKMDQQLLIRKKGAGMEEGPRWSVGEVEGKASQLGGRSASRSLGGLGRAAPGSVRAGAGHRWSG